MENLNFNEFQEMVGEVLVRHKSILDVLSKYQEANARMNRSVIKSVTDCGCVKIDASKQEYPDNIDFCSLKQYLETHIKGDLCSDCKETIESEMGRSLFYLAGICNLLNVDLNKVVDGEYHSRTTLGKYNLT